MSNTEVKVEVHDRTAAARKHVGDIIFKAMTEVFEDDILPEAKALSPVGDEPVRPGSKRNKDSIEVKTFFTKRGPFAKIFTTSGHGGFLEVGTKKMAAQPYIYPAVQANIGKIPEKVTQEIAGEETKANED
jgi:HK97 gp10 family phage protein